MQPSVQIPIARLLPSKTNPRKHFDEAKLRELAANMADPDVGQLQALIVRPTWCQGCLNTAQIAARRGHLKDRLDEVFEVVDGERRWRAAKIGGDALKELRCEVRELTDVVVISIQLITYLQKEPLTPIEEARGYIDLLNLRGEDSKPLHTVETIAKSVGRSADYVYQRKKMIDLPAVGIEALEAGRIGVRLARLIARIPGKPQREEAAKAVISPARLGGDAMSTREAEQFIQANYMKELKGAPFDTDDAALPGPESNPLACTGCVHRTGNNRELFGDVSRGDICTHPPCYRGKCEAVFKRLASEATRDKNVKVLAGKEAESVFSINDGTSLPYDSPYVDFREKPAESFVSSAVERSKLPTWEKLTEGCDVPKVVLQDGTGRMRTLVDRDLAIAAARQNGEDIFVKAIGAAPATNAGDTAARKKAEIEQKRTLAVACAASLTARQALAARCFHGAHNKFSDELRFSMPVEIVEPLLDLAISVSGADGLWFALKTLAVKKAANQTSEQAFFAALDRVKAPGERFALALELLYARALRIDGAEKCAPFVAICDALKIDLKKVRTATVAGLKVKKSEVTVDAKTLAQWVKAEANDMSRAEIARSWRVPLADVDGALGKPKSIKRKAAKPAAKKGGKAK